MSGHTNTRFRGNWPVRDGELDDVQKMAECHTEDKDDKQAIGAVKENLKSHLSDRTNRLYVARDSEDSKKIVGYAKLRPDGEHDDWRADRKADGKDDKGWVLQYLHTHGDHRKQGIATCLLKHIFKQHHNEPVRLKAPSDASLGVYEANGFKRMNGHWKRDPE